MVLLTPFSTHLPLIKIRLFSYKDIINASWSLWKQIATCSSMRLCYLGHLRAQVDLSQVDSLWQQVVEQLAEQHAISEGLSQVTNLTAHAQN